MRIFTLGLDSRLKNDFISIISKYQLQILIDVRRSPKSKFSYFNLSALRTIGEENNFEYIYMGNEISVPEDENFEKYVKNNENFKRGIKFIQELIRRRVVCIICSEKWPHKCQRRFISKKIANNEADVIHIIDIDKAIRDEDLKISNNRHEKRKRDTFNKPFHS